MEIGYAIGIYRLLGIATAQIGLSYRDFYRMTFDEFEAVWQEWRELRQAEGRERWEMMRLQTAILIQPHVKDKITPQALIPFSWDKEREDSEPEVELTAEQRKQRAEEARRKWG